MKIELNNVDTKFNRFQSTLEDIDFFKLPDEVKEQFLECLISIEFIRNLVSVKRPYVQDLPRDEKGRAIIDFTNPPLYENADFFRPTGLLFEKEGVLNPYKPNPAKQSDYYKWVGRDVYRSYNGYLNKETGMWIPGDMYWYLNYCMMDSIVEGEDGIEYNRVITPSFWEGQWWRFLGWYEARKQKLNFAEIASRRKGKSSCAAGRGSRDFYLGESQAAQENIKNLYVADSAIYLNKGGVLNLFEKMIDFIAQNTNFAHERLQSSLNDMIWVSGYTDLNTKTKMGSLNQVQGITISDDPDKPRGKAANFIYFEEFGNFGKLQQTYDTTVYSVKQGKKTRGLVVLAGTGGTRGANFQGALDMIYNPKAMGILPYRNVWDTNQTDNSIFFFPAYVNYEGCINKDGISDVTASLKEILLYRHSKKYGTASPSSLAQAIAEQPITIQDSIMKTDESIFPTAAITERILDIDKNPNSLSDVYVGVMVLNSNGEAEFRPTADAPIRQYPHAAGEKRPGAIEIIEMPIKDKDNKVSYGRYISSLDPVDDDSNNLDSLSLQSFFMFDLWTDTIVAEYTGRTEFASDFYEQTRLLNMFYNAKMMYENNKKGPFSYYQRMHSLKYMAETPDYLKSKGLQPRYSVGNKAYGIHNIGGINATGLEFLRDWLCSPVTIYIPDPEDESKVKETEVMRLYTLKNRAFLQELAKYNPVGNYDRISSMIMLMLYREEKLIVKGFSTWEQLNSSQNENGEDPTFFNEYERRHKKQSKVFSF